MDEFNAQLLKAKDSMSNTLSHFYAQIEPHVPENIKSSVNQYLTVLSGTKKQTLWDEIRGFQVTPATVTLALISVPTLFLAKRLVFPSSGGSTEKRGSKSKNKKKRPSKAQRANKEIQRILDFVEETYVPQIDNYIENYEELSDSDKEYKFKYFEEMLLKELMNLDDVDVVGNEVLRDNRKKVIRFIQDHQKRLDTFKKSN